MTPPRGLRADSIAVLIGLVFALPVPALGQTSLGGNASPALAPPRPAGSVPAAPAAPATQPRSRRPAPGAAPPSSPAPGVAQPARPTQRERAAAAAGAAAVAGT